MVTLLSCLAWLTPVIPALNAPAQDAAAQDAAFQDDKDPQKLFDDIFGPDVRRVKASTDTDDDHKLAKQLIDSVATVKDTPKLVAVICRNAIALASNDLAGLDLVRQGIATLNCRLVTGPPSKPWRPRCGNNWAI